MKRNRLTKCFAPAVWGAFTFLAALSSAAAQQYTITDLGPAYGYVGAFGLNDLGQVVGGALVGSDCHALLWQPGSSTPIDLGSLGGASYALGINDAGVVVGRYGDPFDSGDTNAFIWDSASGMHELSPLPGNLYGTAGSINASGQAAGESQNYSGDPYTHAVIWSAGGTIDLGTLPGMTWSTAAFQQSAINAYGQVVGASGTASTGPVGFLWTPTSPNAATGSMTAIGTLGGTEIVAFSINSSGQVTGNAFTAAEAPHAYLWSPTSPNGTAGTMKDLGTLGGTSSYGQGINDAGQVTGASDVAGDTAMDAFLYSHGTMHDLNSLIPSGSGWQLSEAFSINNSGQIVGYGSINGQVHSYLLTPASQVASISLTPSSVVGSQSTTGKVTLIAPAVGATVVTLSTTNNAATVPATVTVPAGSSTATFTITTQAVAAKTTGNVTATCGGTHKSAKLTVNPIGLRSLTVVPNFLISGDNAIGVVTLQFPAAPGGITVTLSSSNPAVANPTASSFTIPAGTYSAAFDITTGSVTTSTTVTITATANGITKTAKLKVIP